MTAQTSTPTYLPMTFFGLLTGQLNVNNLQVTTSQQAPPNAILIHPATLSRIAITSPGLLIENPLTQVAEKEETVEVPQVPITLHNTIGLCEKLLLQGKSSLTDSDVEYLSRVLDLTQDDLNRKTFDAVESVMELANSISQAQAADQAFINGEVSEEPVQIEESDLDGRATAEDVYDFVQKFVDENGVSGPGYISFDVDFDSPEGAEVLAESAERFKENIEEQGKLPTFSEQLARALAVETARSMAYEKFIDDLAQMVGYASDEEDDEEGFVYDSEA